MMTWTTDQWITFTGVLVAVLSAAGLATLAVRTVRTWTAPALYRTATPALRPTLALAAGRTLPPDTPATGAGLSRALAEETQQLEHVSLHSGRDVADALRPGVGSLADLRATEATLSPPDPLVDPEVARWFAEAFDRLRHVPARNEARELDEGGVMTLWRTAVEPAMRKARRWELSATTSARAELDRWRIDTPTGEYPIVVPRAVAEALLIS